MTDTRLYLKIKVQSLTEEAKLIKAEERRQKSLSRRAKSESKRERARKYVIGLQSHRKHEVREEQRATLLAYGFICGKTYDQIEGNANTIAPHWDRVTAMVTRYGDRSNREESTQLKAWIEASGWKGNLRQKTLLEV